MAHVAGDYEVIPLPLGGAWRDGDPVMVPAGHCRTLENVIVMRSGLFVKRGAYLQEDAAITTGFSGFANWEDLTNLTTRLVAFNTNGANTDLRVKDIGAETYGAAITGTNVTGSPADYTNYRGILYYSMATAGATSTPSGLFSYDGTSVKANPLGGETLYSLCIKAFIDRLFLANSRTTVVNQLGTSAAYDPATWAATTTNRESITSGASVTGRITPTAVTGSKIYKADAYTVAASTSNTNLTFRSNLRSVSATYEMPMTNQIYYSQAWVATTAYSVGAIRVPVVAGGNGYRYRAIAAGTSAAAEPAWPLTVGTTIVDGTVTWVCDGPDAIGEIQFSLPTISDEPNYSTFIATASIPPMPQPSNIGVRIKFGTADTPNITLAPVDFSFKDGLADGVLSKRNYGQQLTVGLFQYPFFNQEASASATLSLADDLYWTETTDPNTIRGSNTYRLREAPGRVTAMAVAGNRLIVWKKRGMWIFQGTADPDSPILLERFFANYGCVGPRAVTVFEDSVYFIGPYQVYSYNPGGTPTPLIDDGNWYEITTQLGYATDNLSPNLAMHEKDRYLLVGVGAASGNFHYFIDRKWWGNLSLFKPNGFGAFTNHPFKWATWNPDRGAMYAASAAVPFKFDDAITSGAVLDNLTGYNTDTRAIVEFPPIGKLTDREEITLHGIALYVNHWLPQSGYTFTVYLSTDSTGGFSGSNTVVLLNNASGGQRGESQRVFIPLGRHTNPSLAISMWHKGGTGQGAFSISRAEALITPERKERVVKTPTNVSAYL